MTIPSSGAARLLEYLYVDMFRADFYKKTIYYPFATPGEMHECEQNKWVQKTYPSGISLAGIWALSLYMKRNKRSMPTWRISAVQ